LPTAQLPTQLLSSHYRFAHERIRQTIYGSIDLDTRSQLHRRIARLWIQQADDPRHPESLLRIVDQYNRFCLELTPDERRELVRLNGLASQQAQAADSAVVAYRYGQMAVSLLHLEDWAMTPEQSCRVLCHYAQLAQQQGQGANAAELLQRALSQDLPCLTQIQLTRMLIRQWAWQGEGPAAIALGRKTLMIWDLGQGDAADESEDKLQTVTPAIAAEVLKLITDLVAIAWGEQPTIWADWITLGRQWVEHCQPELEPQAWLFQNLIAPTPQRLHLEPLVERQEISPEFALSYTVMECWQMRVWREPWPDVAERLEQLAQTQAAEPVMLEHLAAAWGALVLQLAVGQRSLAELSDASQALLTQAERLGMQTFVPAAQQLHQLCQRWQVADTPLSPPQPEATASLWRQTQQSLMQRLAQAFALPEQSHLTSSPSPYPMAMVQTPAMAIEQFEQAIALAQTLEPGAPLPDALTEAQRQCQQWQGQAPIPFQAWAMLLEAEIARLQDQPWAAQAAYDGAIALAQTHQQWPTLGLAAERALQFWLDHQNPAFAQIYYEQAQAAYGQWGAIAKQEHLTQQYPQWARPEPLPSLPPSPAMMASERRPHQAAHRNGVTNTGITDAGITSVGEQTPQPLLQELHRLTNEVNQRTRALTAQNAQLQAEIQGHEDTERALRLAEEKFSKVFHSSPNAIALTNLETGQHLEVNNTFCEVTGYRLDEIVGHTTLEVNLWVNPDDRDRLFKVLNQQGTVRNFEFAFRTKSGEVRTALLAAEIITIHGQRCLLGTSTDITPRKRTEDTLRCQNQALMETLDQLQTTQQELIQAEKMAALGQLIAGVAHEINSPLGAITASTRHLINFWQRHFQDLLAQWRTFDPAQQDLFFTLLDETQRPYPPLSTREQRQLRRALMQQLQDLDLSDPREIANCFVGLGISTLAPGHQALLTQPEGETLLKLAYQLSNLHASMVTISHASERAGKVVFALKNYARFDPSDRKSKANLIDGLETVLMLYHNQLKHSVEVIRQYDEPLPQIACYPDELNQVWTNLIHNSLQAMENKGVLTIAVTQQPAHLAVSITDSGPGIPPEIQAQMFTPFFTTKPPGEGSGLGLDIVRRIVDKHQGEITVASRPGQTTFTILLPLANSETPSEPDES
ncbi:MAG: ATP-binding protein, partial [Spirulinaceae cyanobacterium]